MIEFTSNINEVVTKLTADMNQLGNPEKVLRVVAQSMVAEVHDRIHEQGKDSNDAAIGEYSNSYMALRTGNYKNAEKTKDGKLKNAGTNKSGSKRPMYNRTADKKVILSLTRQMENDFTVIALPDGYGLGYLNDENFKKSQYAENTYKKKIFDLTIPEKETVFRIADFETNRLMNG